MVDGLRANNGFVCHIQQERRWNDAALAIDWPIGHPSLSEKDANAPFLADVPEDRLPIYQP